MTKRQTPPAFTSILWVVVVKPFGPHHSPMCPGSVHTFHTSSRGASKTRVPRISRSPTSAAFLFSAAMLRLLGEQVGQALEGFAPALFLAEAGHARRRGLPHGQLRLAALVGERHRGAELVAGQVVEERIVFTAILDTLPGHELVTTVTFADEGGKTMRSFRT